MTIMSELAVVFGVCLVSEGISYVLPFQFPASVISMILLLILLLTGIVKQKHIGRVCKFLVANMSFFFVAPCAQAGGLSAALLFYFHYYDPHRLLRNGLEHSVSDGAGG